jgi:hypothetical protein
MGSKSSGYDTDMARLKAARETQEKARQKFKSLVRDPNLIFIILLVLISYL